MIMEEVIKSLPRPSQFVFHIKPSYQKMYTTSSQSISSELTVISSDIEGLSAVKASMLSDVFKEQHCHCLCLQETHRGERKARPSIPGMTFVAERPHDKYGSRGIPGATPGTTRATLEWRRMAPPPVPVAVD